MFDISWSEILVVGIVALIVVGPKELPALLRTVGKYLGLIKRQAAEFRAQFDEAMRDAEIEQLKKDVESIKTDAENTLREAERSVQSEMSDARAEFDRAGEAMKLEEPAAGASDPYRHDADGLPMTAAEPATTQSGPAPGAGAVAAAAAAARQAEKAGA